MDSAIVHKAWIPSRTKHQSILAHGSFSDLSRLPEDATISQAELEQLRRIKNIIRKGRVQKITEKELILDEGILPTSKTTVHVDCSARAVDNDEIVPVFQGKKIIPQMVRSYQPVFSAALIAHVEAAYDDENEKNRLCGVVPLPNHDTDYIRFTSAFMMNQYNWGLDEGISKWLLENRLDGFSKMVAGVSKDDTEKRAVLGRIRKNAPMAVMKLQQYLSQI